MNIVLVAMSGVMALSLLAAEAGSASSRLAFSPAGPGEFQFDTGVLRGKLRPGGKARGLSSVVHIPSGLMLDRGDKGYGLFSYYRVFSANKRYGTGAWDWPNSAKLREDGAVEVQWPADQDRPFAMRAIYRWSGPAILDLETSVQPQQDLARFEVFLASYFQEQFTNALVYVSQPPQGTGAPGLIAAEKSLGDWQMFPRDETVVSLIKDGRWQLPPNPVNWVLLPKLRQPLAVRRAPASGLTAVLLAPSEDCFAIATPYQSEGHYSTYLSLIGRDLKSGATARARARLVVGVSLSDANVVQLYKNYSNTVR